MDSIKINDDACRICLQENLKLNWNEEILEYCAISYKDCYYKYTNLEEFDSECYPTNLCEVCANALKDAHMLFEKAVESFNVLQAILATKQGETKHSDFESCSSLTTCETLNFEELISPIDDKTLIHMEDEMLLSPLCFSKRETATENVIDDSEQTTVNECATVEPRHFIDIRHFESSAETQLEKHLNEDSNVETQKLENSKKTSCQRKVEPILNEPCNAKLSKSLTSKKVSKKRRNCEPLPDSLLKEPLNDLCDTELPNASASKNTANEVNNTSSTETFSEQNSVESADKNLVAPATKTKKLRKKASFMCSFCSLRTLSASKLEEHEATHLENRERTVTCQQCGLKLFTKTALSGHIKIHDEKRKKNHKCEFCGNAFYSRGSLNVHRRIHLGLMIKCHICPKEYYRQVDLDRHMVGHSEVPIQTNVEKKKYTVQCQYCNKSVVTINWKSHEAAHLNQPQVKCKICDRNYFSRISCSRHLRRFHHKTASEYEDFIYYYERKTRVSVLMMQQQLSAQPFIANKVP